MSWSCSVCTKKNGPDAEVCVTCMRPRGHKPESAQLKRALDPSRDGERRRERMGFDSEPEDVDGDCGVCTDVAVLVEAMQLLLEALVLLLDDLTSQRSPSSRMKVWCAS